MEQKSIKDIQAHLEKSNTTPKGFADDTPRKRDESKYPLEDEDADPLGN